MEEEKIHIHTQQLVTRTPKDQPNKYYIVDWTKDEKGESQGGRYFPIYDDLRELLFELQEKQKIRGIESEFVLCHNDGSGLCKQSSAGALYQVCKTLGFHITNNYAFRMNLNSLYLIPAGFTPTERAAMLSYSVEMNSKHYSYNPLETEDNAVNRLNNFIKSKTSC